MSVGFRRIAVVVMIMLCPDEVVAERARKADPRDQNTGFFACTQSGFTRSEHGFRISAEGCPNAACRALYMPCAAPCGDGGACFAQGGGALCKAFFIC